MIIKSKNFILRPHRRGDEESLQKNINNKDIYMYTLRIPHPYNLSDADYWIRRCIRISKKKNKPSVHFAIDIGGEVVGGVGFDIENSKAEIGYWLAKKFWNHGIMSEAIKLATDFGFDELKLRRIYANVFSANTASTRVLQRNGYKLEGEMKNYHIKDGKLMDALLYAKTK